MKIGTLTYHDTTNYGAVLQAFALQKKIEEIGFDCEIIDYKCKAITERYEIKSPFKSSNIKQFVKRILTNKNNKALKSKFEDFNKKYQKISSKAYDKKSIKEANKVYDKFIVGSDQIWNLKLCGEDTTYMLDFVDENSKKYSYAASFGYPEIPNEYVNISKQYIEKFNKISVRENKGVDILNKICDKTATITLDPTLLFDKNDWKKYMNLDVNKTISKKPYILVYIIALTPTIMNFTKKLAKETGYEVIYINHSYKRVFGFKNIFSVTPEEFLTYINNAEIVVTSSFHGVAFSINFEKQFFYELSNSSVNYNSRLENLISIAGLNEREIKKENNNYKNSIKIDYEIVKPKIEKEKVKSIQFIKEVLSE